MLAAADEDVFARVDVVAVDSVDHTDPLFACPVYCVDDALDPLEEVEENDGIQKLVNVAVQLGQLLE